MTGRIPRIINFTVTDADTWYKIFDENDYQNNRIFEITVKLRETSTADHFRYNYDNDSNTFMTSTSGMAKVLDAKKIYAYIPTVAAQVLEVEVIYK